MKLKPSACLVALLATVAVLPAALAPGGAAYTKRADVSVLAQPQMGSQTVGRLGYAQKVSVNELQGTWARISGGSASGWVFGGNLSDQAPADTQGFDGLPISASNTTASAAARPLTADSQQYAGRRGLHSASSDLAWLSQHATLRPNELPEFLKAQKKGEFQQ
jgi:hypothetical protein